MCWPHAFWQSCTRGRLGALSNDAYPITDNEFFWLVTNFFEWCVPLSRERPAGARFGNPRERLKSQAPRPTEKSY